MHHSPSGGGDHFERQTTVNKGQKPDGPNVRIIIFKYIGWLCKVRFLEKAAHHA